MRWRWILVVLSVSPVTYAQSLLDVRGIGMSSDISTAVDLPALYTNPAGIASIQAWQVNTTNAYVTSSRDGLFGNIAVADRFYRGTVGAFSYAPSRHLDFEFISTIQSEGRDETNAPIITEVNSDKRIKYQEPVKLGYGYAPAEGISIGLAAGLFREDIDELRTTVVTRQGAALQSDVARETYSSSTWNLDAGLLYQPWQNFHLGIVAYNLLALHENELPDKYMKYAFVPEKVIRIGAAVHPTEDMLISADMDTRRRFNFGAELNAIAPTSPFVLRLGSWMDFRLAHPLNALSFGAGYRFKSVSFDASYISFLDKTLRTGTLQDDLFTPVSNLEVNQYTSDRFSFSVSVSLGTLRDAVARIEHLHISNTIFPASYRVHATRPLGFARVRNLTDKPIKVHLRFFVKKLMDVPTETGEYYLEPEEMKEIPFTAEFNESILSVRSESFEDSEVGVIASEVDNYEDVLRTKLLVHDRNSWNGDPLMLKYFVTPADPSVIHFTRRALSYNRDFLESVPASQRRLEQARCVFNAFANMLTYIADPRAEERSEELEHVQYPTETLDLRGGDCDDFTVCYSALLNSLGFETAFVDVQGDSLDADGNTAHIYLLFDTGVEAAAWQKLSSNEKKLVARKNSTGIETIWIPVETTAIARGFDAAWDTGALEYLHDVEYTLGLLRGTVKIVDVFQPD